MAEYTEDTIVYPTMIKIAACLETELTKAGLPQLCFLGIMPGNQVALDFCDGCGTHGQCGQAWVRLVTAYPSSSFPNPDNTARVNVDLAYVLEVAVMRCAPKPDSQGNPPGVADMLESTRLQMADMAAIRRALECCLKDVEVDYSLGSYSAYGPQGGCVGGSWTITLSTAAED